MTVIAYEDEDDSDNSRWLECPICGWEALLSQGNIHASEVGDPCKYREFGCPGFLVPRNMKGSHLPYSLP